MKKYTIAIIALLIIGLGAWWIFRTQEPVVNIGNELEKAELIRLTTPQPNQSIQSPLTITGEALGGWYFEGSFPVMLTDWEGKTIAQGVAKAKGDWMTEDFVPFEAKLTFSIDKNAGTKGMLILRKDNPSGLPETENALVIPIMFAKITSGNTGGTPSPVACTMEAKLCPDGSYVGRTGPNCEFTACPTSSSGGGSGIMPFKSGVHGTVTLGPTCPVMREPPDPQCADKPYATEVQIWRKSTGTLLATTRSNKNGEYSFSLSPSVYILKAIGGKTLPHCEEKEITIQPGVMLSANISCDTGIR